jgi:PPK2 family polyphosphate:nucleotide phosphotransferase
MPARDFRVAPGSTVRLKDWKTGSTGPYDSKDQAEALLRKDLERLRELQGVLYARREWAVLVVLQAMDAAGKDSAISHVMSGLNPQGCRVHSFKTPSTEELDHTFLWRVSRALPERGLIGVFNRSHYEEAIVVRVHPDLLRGERVPRELLGRGVWKERFEDINAFELHLSRNGVMVLKFFLHVSKAVQRERFLARLKQPRKNWKFEPSDIAERARWGAYQAAYEEVLSKTSTKAAPWYIIPADHKWFTWLCVTSVIVERLEGLGLSYPEPGPEAQRAMRAARRALKAK